MPSPFHQKYSTQSSKVFKDSTVPPMPEPTKETERRGSDASMNDSPPSPVDARRRSSGQRFGNLHSLKRPDDEHHANRRASLQDSYGKVGFLGTLWNNYTRGPAGPSAPKEPRDTTTLRG